MQENINIPDSTITSALTFRNLVLMNMQQLTNFPYIEKDFDALTDYELLCLVVKYLNDVIANQNEQNNSITRMYRSFLALQTYVNNTKDTLESAFNSLDDYVRNYFGNLDVQNEIDNKLDEMVEHGTLQEIISDYLNSKAVFGFDTVTDLKSSTNLINGSYARTLGYHNVNDDGGALYKIRTITNDDVVDEMFILEMENDDSLIAELIIENAININTLGADNTATTDSSAIFNAAFTKISNNWYNQDTRINTVTVNGKYKIENQVTMPPFAKLKGTGYVTFLTNVSGSAFKIDYLSTNIPTFEGNKQDWLMGEMINLSQGGLFKNVGTNLTNTCIEVGRNSDIGAYIPYSRYKMCNFRIYNYNIGILHNAYHNYIGKFDNISFESNNIGVQYGALSGSATDSGENMTYNNCLFASGINGIKWLVPSFDSSFVNCSFDFLQNCFNDSENKGYKRISIINSHLEGFNYICSSLGTHSQMIIQQSSIMYTQRGNMFDNISDNSIITLNNNKILPFKTDIYDPELLTDNSNRISLLNNFVGHGALSFLFTKNNLINNFDNLQDGDITLAVNNSIGIFTVKALTGNVLTAKIVTDNYLYTGHKSLVLVSTTDEATTKTINLESNYIPINSIRTILYSNIITYNCRGGQNIFFRFYDENKELIFETSGYQFMPENSNKEPSKWYMDPYGKKVNVPSNAQYMKVQYNINNMNNSTADEIGTEYKIGGLIIN